MSWYKFVVRLVSFYYRLVYRVAITGMDNIPREGGFLLCCNHKSNNDPPFLGSAVPVQISILAKKELFEPFILGSLLQSLGAIPLDRNANDVSAIKTSMSIMRGGKGLLVFPQGGRKKEMEQKDFRPGSLMMAHRAKVPVIFARIDGDYKLFSKMRITVGNVLGVEQLAKIVQEAPDEERNIILSKLIYSRITEL